MNNKKGFTLVELSIVLVIIGLLIGGILVGQSLISSAEINKEVRRLSQYVIAIEQFKQKFKQDAGDTNLFSNPGNNNGDVDGAFGVCPARNYEIYAAWSHLTQSGMLTGEKYVWPNPGVGCAGWVDNNGSGYVGVTPINKITANGRIEPYFYQAFKSAFDYGGNKYNRYFAIHYNPEILWGLENKLDDSVPSISTGRIYSSEPFGTACTFDAIQLSAADYKYCYTNILFHDSLN